MEARLWFRQFLWDVDDPYQADKYEGRGLYSLISGQPSGGNVLNVQVPLIPARAAACASCPRGCRMRLATGESNEAVCAGTMAVNVRPPIRRRAVRSTLALVALAAGTPSSPARAMT